MVVLSRSGSLVGTVARAYEDFAWIRLITDPDSAVNAQVSARACSAAADPRRDVIIPSTPTPAAPAATPAPTPAPSPTPTDAGATPRAVSLRAI